MNKKELQAIAQSRPLAALYPIGDLGCIFGPTVSDMKGFELKKASHADTSLPSSMGNINGRADQTIMALISSAPSFHLPSRRSFRHSRAS